MNNDFSIEAQDNKQQLKFTLDILFICVAVVFS